MSRLHPSLFTPRRDPASVPGLFDQHRVGRLQQPTVEGTALQDPDRVAQEEGGPVALDRDEEVEPAVAVRVLEAGGGLALGGWAQRALVAGRADPQRAVVPPP